MPTAVAITLTCINIVLIILGYRWIREARRNLKAARGIIFQAVEISRRATDQTPSAGPDPAAPSGLQLDVLGVVQRLEQLAENGWDSDPIVRERLYTCDVPRLRGHLTSATRAWELEMYEQHGQAGPDRLDGLGT